MKRTQRGNILFLILLAVVLFAALSYAVTQGMRGGGKSASSENADLAAAQMIQHGSQIENHLTRAMLTDSVPEYGFDLSGTYSMSLTNGTCTAANCRVLSGNANGSGPVASLRMPTAAIDPGATASYANEWFVIIPITHVKTPLSDVIMVYRGLTKDACEAINRRMDVPVNLSNATGLGDATGYSGTLTSITTGSSVLGNAVVDVRGRTAACFNHTVYGYTFYYVVMAR